MHLNFQKVCNFLLQFRIFKKRKSEEFFDVCDEWHQEDIKLLTGSENMQYKNWHWSKFWGWAVT